MNASEIQSLINKYDSMFNEVNTNWNPSRESEYKILESILADLVKMRDAVENGEEYDLDFINSQY